MSKDVGALWIRKYKRDGEDVTYLSGTVDLGVGGKAQVAVFRNERKDKDNHPDYRIVLSDTKKAGDEESKPTGNVAEPFGEEPF